LIWPQLNPSKKRRTGAPGLIFVDKGDLTSPKHSEKASSMDWVLTGLVSWTWTRNLASPNPSPWTRIWSLGLWTGPKVMDLD
jgi:hypothetical protein